MTCKKQIEGNGEINKFIHKKFIHKPTKKKKKKKKN